MGRGVSSRCLILRAMPWVQFSSEAGIAPSASISILPLLSFVFHFFISSSSFLRLFFITPSATHHHIAVFSSSLHQSSIVSGGCVVQHRTVGFGAALAQRLWRAMQRWRNPGAAACPCEDNCVVRASPAASHHTFSRCSSGLHHIFIICSWSMFGTSSSHIHGKCMNHSRSIQVIFITTS